MAQALVLDLPDDILESLKRRAASNGRSLEEELREIVMAAAAPVRPPLSGAERIEIVDRHLAHSKHSKHNSTDIIRKHRDSR